MVVIIISDVIFGVIYGVEIFQLDQLIEVDWKTEVSKIFHMNFT